MRADYFGLKCGIFLLSFILLLQAKASDIENKVFSIRLKQAPLVAVLQQLALEQNSNLIIDDELEGTISLQLENTNLNQLLYAIAKIKQLDLWQENNIYYLTKIKENPIKFTSPIGSAETNEYSAAADIFKPITISIPLQFAKASEVIKSLTSGNGSLLSSNGTITFDERSNLLIIRDNKESIQNIKKLIIELDKPIEQIAIEARIVTMNNESLQELGIRWGLFEATANAHTISGRLEANNFNNLNDNLNINLPSTNIPTASVALQVAKINGRLLDLELTALERENNVKIIASPKLLTTNKKSASIKQGTEIPYVSTNEKNGSQHIEFREAVLGLEVTPHISKNNTILLDLIVSQNSPSITINSNDGEIILIDKQEINTQVFAKDGETIVLGGIFHDTVTKNIDKVPLLGDIPGIKHLFTRESERHQKRELVIFVTPHILKQEPTSQSFK